MTVTVMAVMLVVLMVGDDGSHDDGDEDEGDFNNDSTD